MLIRTYLHVSRNGNVRHTKTPIAPNNNEIRVDIDLNIPNEFFQKPNPKAVIEFPKDLAPKPIEAIVHDVAEAVSTAFSIEVQGVQEAIVEGIRATHTTDDEHS